MRKYFYIFILIPFLISGCDYTPIYSNKASYNFFIEKIELNGDAEINNLIDKKLKKYRTAKSEKKFLFRLHHRIIKFLNPKISRVKQQTIW